MSGKQVGVLQRGDSVEPISNMYATPIVGTLSVTIVYLSHICSALHPLCKLHINCKIPSSDRLALIRLLTALSYQRELQHDALFHVSFPIVSRP